MCDFNDNNNKARYFLIMAHLELLYANGWISDEDFNLLEEVYARKYMIPDDSLCRIGYKKQ